MKALVTVIGHDSVGIIGGVCTKLANLNINILDISQTVMQECFTMMMMIEMDDTATDMETVREELNNYGKERALDIRIQRTDIFDAMYRI